LKNKISKILGLGLTLVIALALVMGFVAPVAASPGETINEWYKFGYPEPGADGDWFRDASITRVGPIAEAINGDLYAYATVGSEYKLFKSDDGGRTWAATGYEDVDLDPSTTAVDPPGPIVDMVYSSIDEDIIYVTDGNYVYKSTDGGDEFGFVGRASLEEAIAGFCGWPILNEPITSIDVGYDGDDNPFVFIGTRMWVFPGSVYWIGEAGYPAAWTNLQLPCYGVGYDALAVGCAPDFADSKQTFVVVSNGTETHVIYTGGVTCSWSEFAELVWDCAPANHFGSYYASRIGFPDDWEDTETLFVGVVDVNTYFWDCLFVGDGGDVYMAMDGSALDMNVKGITTGCIGIQPADIISLDVMGDSDEASLIAGSFCCNEVYCSTDGGWSWDASDKDPTGAWLTYAIWYEDTALAGTSGCECAVSMCCGEDYPCEFWNQISLISTDIECVIDIDHSPGYVCGDSETMFMLTNQEEPGDCCFPCQEDRCYDYTQSLFRYDGTYWERVYCSVIGGSVDTPDEFIFVRVHVSPDFNTTNALYLTNRRFEIWRTLDAGCSWGKLTFPCTPRPEISAEVVIDEDTVIVGGRGANRETIYKTTRHGARPWAEYEATGATDGVSFALEPGYEDPGSILFGDEANQVFISEDGGEEWDLVGDCVAVLTGHDTFVVFDPAYATNDIIYAAAGTVVARCIIDTDAAWADQAWEVICDNLGYAKGIKAAGDTALYVTDGDITDDCEVTTDPCCDDGVPDWGGVIRSLNPDAADADDVIFERIANGLLVAGDPAKLKGLWLTCDTSDKGCAENVLWALEPTRGVHDCENIWVYEDTLAAPVVLAMPINEQKLGTTDQATLSWNALCGADCYEVSLWKYCAECPDEKLIVSLDLDCAPGECCVVCAPAAAVDECACPAGECVCTSDTCIVVDGLESGTEYHWQVRVCLCKPVLSKWSEERTFMTALLPVPFADLCSPACGSQDIILTPNFAWGPVTGATGYDIELATTETFTAGVVRGSSTVNAWVAPEPLEYSATYYWRVRAEKDGVYSGWTVCMFTTMGRPEAPPPPVVVEQVPPPQITVEVPVEQIAPNWIYAIMGIGAALVVVVIVLIARTRRPSA